MSEPDAAHAPPPPFSAFPALILASKGSNQPVVASTWLSWGSSRDGTPGWFPKVSLLAIQGRPGFTGLSIHNAEVARQEG